MPNLRIMFAGRDYDRTRSLISGETKITGVDLNYLVFDEPDTIFRRMIDHEDFDTSELSISSFLTGRAAGDERFVAIPVFPSRVFRHSFVLLNKDAGIAQPGDLEGKRVGLMEWQQSAAVWMKGILQHEYDVDLHKIHWVRFASERYRHVKPSAFMIQSDPDLSPSSNAEEKAGMALEKGEIDALLAARLPSAFYSGKNSIMRLFKEDWAKVEAEYYRKTGIFPIMHTVVIRKSVYAENRWLAPNMVDAFEEAKRSGYRTLARSADKMSLVWARRAFEEQQRILGIDPYPYNLQKENRKVIETLLSFQAEQQIIKDEPDIEGLFAPNTI